MIEANNWNENLSIILVRPEFLGNIGSTCRVMKNFGFSDLRLVEAPKNYKDSEARMMAVGAFDILKQAKLFDSLEEAVEDIGLTIATSSGRKRSRPLKNLFEMSDEIIAFSKENKVAIVFGHERNGLRDDEMALLNRKVRIETSLEFPSMNVAQAVCAVLYALAARANLNPDQPSEVRKAPQLPSAAERRDLFEQFDLLVDNIEFSRSFNKDKVLAEIRDAFERMTPTRRESALIKGVLFNLNRKLSGSNSGSDE